MKILAFAGSVRKGSLNKALLKLACDNVVKKGAEVEVIDLADFDMPLYSGDIEDSKGIPANALKLKDAFDKADAVIISAPEYNFSVSGVLKNAVDWMSRIRPQQPFKHKQILLMSASPSMIGGNRGLWALRVPLEALGAFVYPEMFSLSVAHEAFDNNGVLKDPALSSMLKANVDGFIEYIK